MRQNQRKMTAVKIILIIGISLGIFMITGLYSSLNLLWLLRLGGGIITILFAIFMALAMGLFVPRVRTFSAFSVPPDFRIMFNFESKEAFAVLKEITAEIFLWAFGEKTIERLKGEGCFVRFNGLYEQSFTESEPPLEVTKEAICELKYDEKSKTFKGKTKFLGAIPDDYGVTILYKGERDESENIIGNIRKVIHIDPPYVSLQLKQNQWLMALTILILLFTFTMVIFGIAQIILAAYQVPEFQSILGS